MPLNPKYPLKPLLEHRERKVDDATVGLGDAIRARESAESAERRAEEAKRAAEEQAATVKAEEAERLARGELRAADLAREQAWAFGANAHINELARSVAAAEQKTLDARGEELEAQRTLAEKMADRDVVVKDEERFEKQLEKRATRAEEEAAEEAWRDRRR